MKTRSRGLDDAVIVRDARPGELAEVGRIRVTAYLAGGHLSPDSAYAPVLRDLGTADDGTVLVAVADQDDGDGDHTGGRILGTVMLQSWPDAGQVVTGEGEAEIRALAVPPEGQGSGTGSALLRAVIERAARTGVRHLLLFTQPDMLTAQHMYRREGFLRIPGRDWSPVPGFTLLAYGLRLTPDVT